MAKAKFKIFNKGIIISLFGIGILLLILSKTIDPGSLLGFNRIKGVPKEVNQFLELQDVKKLSAQGFTTYTGNNPANIEGSYLSNDMTVTYDPGTIEGAYVIGDKMDPYTYTFSNQTNSGTLGLHFISTDDQSQGTINAFISGDSNCFTIYSDGQGQLGECKYVIPMLISACSGENGFTSFKQALLAKSKQGPTCEEEVMPIGYFRTFEEEDGIVEKQ